MVALAILLLVGIPFICYDIYRRIKNKTLWHDMKKCFLDSTCNIGLFLVLVSAVILAFGSGKKMDSWDDAAIISLGFGVAFICYGLYRKIKTKNSTFGIGLLLILIALFLLFFSTDMPNDALKFLGGVLLPLGLVSFTIGLFKKIKDKTLLDEIKEELKFYFFIIVALGILIIVCWMLGIE